ncbi:MAG: CrcB protein [Verrucomicrobiales bacterium]|jgi:CrcB protein
MIIVGVALAAAIGSTARAAITSLDGDFRRKLWGTLLVNLVGSFLLGLLSGTSEDTMAIAGIGALGAFTTFSTYISQIEYIYRENNLTEAAFYAIGAILAGVGAAYLGYTLEM